MLLRQVRETLLEGQCHQAAPFEKVVEAVQPERSTSHSPIFQVAFNLQNTPSSSEYSATSVSSMFDLSLFMWEDAGGFRGAFEYRTDLFRERTIARMAEHFSVLAAAMVEDPDRPVALLPLLSQEERTALLDTFNRTGSAYPRERTIPDLVSLQAARTPGEVAVILPAQNGHGAKQITYRELDVLSNRLAHRLRALGVGRQALAGVCMERSVDMVVALLAVLKAGGAYVPMDPHLAGERLNFMMEDAGLGIVLCDESFRRSAPPGIVLITPDDDGIPLGVQRSPPADGASAEDLAYVIYTSGSTGKPKGSWLLTGRS